MLSTLSFLQITFAQSKSEDGILAQIGEKKISVEEFLQRSELTIRPNNFKDKKVALNNLVSEKMLALEAGHNGKLLEDPVLQARLRGIKEQLMRDKLYDEAASKRVELVFNEVENVYKLSMREYEVEFYTIRHKEVAEGIEALIELVPDLAEEVLKEIQETVGKKPVRKVKYKDRDDDAIHEALFTWPLDPGSVVGPLKLNDGSYIILKVLNWVDYPLISGEDQQVRWKEVQEKLHQSKALKLWRSYQTDVMRGKRIEFDKQSFGILSDWAMRKYLSNDSKNDSLGSRMTEVPPAGPEIDMSAPCFTLDGRVWTIGDFEKEVMCHPLVYRTTNLDSSNFKEQFKLAIADMMGDHYVTQEAYKRSLDGSEGIHKTVEMWKDAFLAVDQERSVISSAKERGIIHSGDNVGILKYWTSYLEALQKKYSGMIQINYDEFDKISLTNIDMFAWRPGVPYPVAVPAFPIFISSENLEDLTPSLTLP